MKKLFYSLFALALSAMTFTSCEDVPMPYDQPGEGGGEPVIVEPSGDGTAENPFNVAAAIEKCKEIGSTESAEKYYVKGKVAATTPSDDSYGNATFDIVDYDGGEAFKCYQVAGSDGKKLPNGFIFSKDDEVVVYGPIYNFKGNTPETAGRGVAYVVTVNGQKTDGGSGDTPTGEAKGNGTLSDPYNPLGAANAVKNLTWTDNNTYDTTDEVYVKGKISRIADKGTFTDGGTFGNASFYISEDGTKNGEFYCFRVLYLGNKKFAAGQTDIKVGDEVFVCGHLMNYRGNTPETEAGKAYLYLLNGKSEGGGGGDTPTGTEINCAKAVELTNALADNATSSETYTVTGYITEVVGNVNKNQQTFWMADTKDGGKVFEAFWANLPDGVSEFKAGSKVKITGKLMKYVKDGNVTPEIKNANVEIIEEGGGGGSEETDYQGSQAGEVNENVITVQVSKFNLENQEKLKALKLTDGTTLKFDGGGNSNTPAYYSAGDGTIRMYPKNTMTISAGDKTIVEVEITAEDYNGTIYNASGNINISGATKTVSNNILTYTNVNSSNVTVSNDASGSGAPTQLRFKVLKITYAK